MPIVLNILISDLCVIVSRLNLSSSDTSACYLRCLHTAQHSMQHVVQHVALNVASNVLQQVAAFNTYRAVCKFVACNSQKFRTNPILLSVACNKFKYWVQQPIKTRLSDHVTRRVWWLDLSKKGTPSSLTNLKLRCPASGVFPRHIITAGRCGIVTCIGMRRLSVDMGTI